MCHRRRGKRRCRCSPGPCFFCFATTSLLGCVVLICALSYLLPPNQFPEESKAAFGKGKGFHEEIDIINMRIKFIQDEIIAVTEEIIMEERMIYLEAAYIEVEGDKPKKGFRREGDEVVEEAEDSTEPVTTTQTTPSEDMNLADIFQPSRYRMEFKRESVSSMSSSSQSKSWSSDSTQNEKTVSEIKITPKPRFFNVVFTQLTTTPSSSKETTTETFADNNKKDDSPSTIARDTTESRSSSNIAIKEYLKKIVNKE